MAKITIPKYRVVGSKLRGYAVIMRNGVCEYDLLEDKKLALVICEVLNSGSGPEWEAIEDQVNEMLK